MTLAPKPKSSSRLQFEAMVEIIKSIPNSLTSAKAYDRLRRDLTKAGFDFDGYSNTDQQRVKRARAEAGFEVREKMWVRR